VILAKVDTSDLEKRFSALEREHLPAITAQAVNRAAEYVRDVVTAEIPRVFNAPVALTQKSVFLTTYASKRGPFVRDVFLRDEASKGTPPVKYLAPEVEGGPRRVKRFERALKRSGVMAESEFAYPARSYKLNAQGNINAGVVTRILSQLSSSSDSLQNVTGASRARGRASGKAEYFAVGAGRSLKPGVYQRTGPTTSKRTRKQARAATKAAREFGPARAIKAQTIVPRGVKPVLVFSSTKPSYTPRFDFKGLARKHYVREYVDQFRLAASLRLGRNL
jgi:hypothetical protein